MARSQRAAVDPAPGKARGRGTRRVAGALAAVATIVAALAGFLATRCGWEIDVEERSRTAATSEARNELHRLSLDAGRLTDSHIAATEAVVRVGAAQQRLASAPASQRPRLRATLAGWRRVADRVERANPLPAREVLARGYVPAVTAQQRADRHAALSHEWTLRESANVATAGLLAVAVLLVAPVVAVAGIRRPYRLIVVAAAVVAFSVVRLVAVNAHAPEAVSDDAIAAFTDGTLLRELGDHPAAADAFVRAVSLEPRYAAAWEALGDTYLGDVDAWTAGWAVDAYERAIALQHPTGSTLNNLAYAELLSGRTASAARHAAQAVALLPNDLRAVATAAEVLVAEGSRRPALAAADALIARLAVQPSTTREEVFSALRADEADLAAAGVGAGVRDEFYGRLRRAAATLEAFGVATPRSARHVTARIRATYDTASLRMNYVLTCRGARADDKIGVRVFRGPSLVASAVHGAPEGSCVIRRGLAVDVGTYTVEVYVNGNLTTSSDHAFTY